MGVHVFKCGCVCVYAQVSSLQDLHFFSVYMFMRGGVGWGMGVAGESVVGAGGCGFEDVMCLYVCIDVSCKLTLYVCVL
jgi:hypothetical protein